MSEDSDWTPTVPKSVHVTRHNQEATASGIYGVIVSSAVMSASNAEKAYQVIVAVLVTLTIYWGAERYARIVAERIHEGHRPNWSTVRHQLTHGWEMVTASTLPLVVLAVMSVLGAVQHRVAVRGRLGRRTRRAAHHPRAGGLHRRRGHVRHRLHHPEDPPSLNHPARMATAGTTSGGIPGRLRRSGWWHHQWAG